MLAWNYRRISRTRNSVTFATVGALAGAAKRFSSFATWSHVMLTRAPVRPDMCRVTAIGATTPLPKTLLVNVPVGVWLLLLTKWSRIMVAALDRQRRALA